MLLRHELQQLASALKATQEFTKMVALRKKIMGDPTMGRLMKTFEKEHTQVLNLGLLETEAAARLTKLYADYASFLEKQDVRDYIKAAQDYQMMITENIKFLNSLLDAGSAGR